MDIVQIESAEDWYALTSTNSAPWLVQKPVALWARRSEHYPIGLVGGSPLGIIDPKGEPNFLGYFHKSELTTDKIKELASIGYYRNKKKEVQSEN